jgi:lantibiotic leader peptide-processing serine protease
MTRSRLQAARIGTLALVAITASACADSISPSASPSAIAPPALSRVGTVSSDRHVMEFNNGIPSDLAARVAAKGGTLVRVDAGIGMAVTSGLTDAAADAIAGKANNSRDLNARWIPTLAEMQGSVAADASATLAPSTNVTAKSPLTAAFYVAGLQWDMQQIRADAAWAQGRTGIPTVRVAILDTGLDPDHIDQNGTVIDRASSTFFTPSVSPDGGPRWIDDNFHGTHVGGTVTTNNIGTAGTVPNVTLVAVKVLNAAGSGSFADIISGIYYATDAHVQVINMSLGAFFQKNGREAAQLVRLLNKAINYAHAHDVLVVSSAGNDNIDLQHDQNYISVPCEAGVQICVSSTGITDTKASYSNYGTDAITVAAPGGDFDAFVLGPCSSHSVDPALAACKSRSRYLYVIGTSQAAPHVSGLGAYLDSQFGGMLTASQMITSIEQHADDLGKPGADPFYGHGRINVFATVNDPTP